MKILESINIGSFILKPECGYGINWVFNSRRKLSISVGVLSAIGVVLVINFKGYIKINISDRHVASPSFWAVPGLQNLGNNCFLNVVLQALASCLSFRKYLRELMEEYGSVSVEGDEIVPLVNSLTSLVEELCTVRDKRTILSPRKLMLAMDHYIPKFNLDRQQDAEEAFSHLLSSLREEISEHFVTSKSSLADLPALPNGRILITKRSKEENEWQRWSRSFLKPFDGILSSILICKSCSFQISLDFQLFHSLHLSPPTSSNGKIIAGCTLEDCLKQFFAAENIENYCCSSCWHTAAIGYVSAFTRDKMRDIEKLQSCYKDDSCECKTLSSIEAFPWSNRFSHVLKQLSIARSPKILCIHLQRASYDLLGQTVKLMGHVAFPLILDLSSFMNTGVGIKTMDANLQFGPLFQISREIRHFPYSKYQTMPVNPRMLGSKASTAKSISSGTVVAADDEEEEEEEERTAILRLKPYDSILPSGRRCVNSNGDVILLSAPFRHQIFRLVSVVEHFGTSGSGHYTVYRKVTAKIGNEQWFCISDSEVYSVSEKDALDANASMLLYEKVDDTHRE